jgi:hypothetical protein
MLLFRDRDRAKRSMLVSRQSLLNPVSILRSIQKPH